MKIRKVTANDRKKSFEVVARGKSWSFPYAKADPPPTASDPIERVFVDPELGRMGFTYVLESGTEGGVMIDHVLEYNRDPACMRDLLLHKLSIEAQQRLKRSRLSRREIVRRLGTSPAQLYRLLDQTNYRKSIDRMVSLLQVLGCEIDIALRDIATT
jgi:predicted XRE-type DNA-binding protein